MQPDVESRGLHVARDLMARVLELEQRVGMLTELDEWLAKIRTQPLRTAVSAGVSLEDLDGDTKVQVEESSDEDKIRMDTGGTERVVIDASGIGLTGSITVSGTVDGVDIAARDHAQAHGPTDHTGFANWKAIYTDASGDQQEVALGANGTFFQSGGASTLPEFTALVVADIPYDDGTSDPLATADAAADGTENSPARKDHVHPLGGTAGGDLGGTYPNPTVDDGSDSTAIHDNVANEITAITNKNPVDADEFVVEDSAASYVKKAVLFSALEAALTHDSLVAGTIASHDTSATGAELDTLTDGSTAGGLHVHVEAEITDLDHLTGAEAVAAVAAADDYLKNDASDSTSGALTAAGFVTTGTAFLREVSIDSTPANDTCSGVTAELTAGAALTRGDCCYVGSDGKMEKTDADAEATSRCIAIVEEATIAEDAAGTFLLHGFFEKEFNFATVGAKVYLDTATAGGVTLTAPSGTDDTVTIVGISIAADCLYFNPTVQAIVEHT